MARAKPKTSRTRLLIEIESGLVRASVIALSPKVTETISVSTSTFTLRPASTAQLIKNMLRALKASLADVAQNFELYKHLGPTKVASISEVHYVLSSPWILSQAQTVSHTFSGDKKLSRELVSSILDRYSMEPKTHVQGKRTIVERVILDVAPGGYSIPRWQGIKAQNIEITCMVSAIDRSLQSELRKACEHIVEGAHIYTHSALVMGYFESLHSLPQTHRHISVHIHHDVTDMLCVDSKQGIFFGSFPIGYKTLEKRLARSLSIRPRAAASLLSLHAEDHLDQSHARKVIHAIHSVMSAWKHDYIQFLNLATGGTRSSSQINMFTDTHAGLFAQAVKSVRSGTEIEITPQSTYTHALEMV